MIRKYLLPLLAVLGLGFAVLTVVSGSKTIPPARRLLTQLHRPSDRRWRARALWRQILKILPSERSSLALFPRFTFLLAAR